MPLTYENNGVFVNTLVLRSCTHSPISLKLLILVLILLPPKHAV